MQKIDDNTYIINSGMGAVVRFGAAGKDKTPAHSLPKLLPSSSDSEEWCNWGDDNLYPKRLMEKVEKVGAAVGGLEVLTSAHLGTGLKIFELVET